MARVLFLTSAHPGGRGHIGAGEGVSEGNVRALVDAGHEVHVFCIASEHQFSHPDILALCATYTTLRHTLWQSLLGVLSNLRYGALLAPWFFTRVTQRNFEAIRHQIKTNGISRVWIEFPSSLGFSMLLQDFELDYFIHDVVSQKVGRKPFLKCLQPWVARVESRLLSTVRYCHVMSEKDANLVRQLNFDGHVSVALPQSIKVGEVNDAIPVGRIVEEFLGGRNLVFFGNMSRPENHMSMIYFLLLTYPKIKRACPDVQLWIIGLGPRRSLRCLGRILKGVHVTGPVDDPLPAFAAASVCIAPLRFGAGVKIKVLQMLEAGAKVIATPIGAEGVPASDRLSVVYDQEFAEAVLKELNVR